MPFAPDDLHVVRFPDPIRRRPEMYVGDIGLLGLHELARGLMECPRDPVAMTVTIEPGTVVIDADSIGPSLVPRAHNRPPFLVDVATIVELPLDSPPTVAAAELLDTHGDSVAFVRTERAPVALPIANALAACMTLESRRGGVLGRARFVRGSLIDPMTLQPTGRPDGFAIRFEPDPEIFTVTTFRFHLVAAVARDVAAVRHLPIRVLDAQRQLSYFAGSGGITPPP